MKKKTVILCCLTLVGIFMLFVYRDLLLRLWTFRQEDTKDASIIAANINDATMIDVYDEFQEFDEKGYIPGKYLKLEQLYSNGTDWKTAKKTLFYTSVRMQTFGADKAAFDGRFEKLIELLDNMILGYKQFIDIRQEAMACIFIQPAINLTKRIVLSKQDKMPKDINAKIMDRMLHLRRFISKSPEEPTSDIKDKNLSKIDNIIYLLKNNRTDNQ